MSADERCESDVVHKISEGLGRGRQSKILSNRGFDINEKKYPYEGAIVSA